MKHSQVLAWVDEYVAAWRTPGIARLAKVFAENVSYRLSPWKEPIQGLAKLGPFWEQTRDGHDEVFELQSEIIAVENNTAVVRLQVDYANDTPRKWRDLWILTFDSDGLCCAFEEWPFAEGQYDGQKS